MEKNSKREHEITKTSLRWSSIKVLGQIVLTLGSIYFARTLGAELLGIYFLFTSVPQLLTSYSNLGLGIALKKRISENEDLHERWKFFWASVVPIIFITFFLASLILIFRGYITIYVGRDYTFFILLSIFLLTFKNIFSATLLGMKKISYVASINLARDLFTVLVQFLLIFFLHIKVEGMIYGFIFGILISSLLFLKELDVKVAKFDFFYFKSLLKFSRFAFLSQYRSFAYRKLDVFMIRILIPDSQAIVGVYSICWKFSQSLNFFSQGIVITLFPKISEWSSKRDFSEIERVFRRGLEYISLLTVPAFFGVLIVSKSILGVLYGREYVIGSLVLTIHMASALLQTYSGIIITTLQGLNRPEKVFITDILSIFINVLLNLLLIKYFGFQGAAVATFSTVLVLFLINFYHVKKILRPEIPLRGISTLYLSSIMMSGIVLLLNSLLPKTKYNLFFTISVGVFVYFTTLIQLNRDLRMRIFSLFQSLRREKLT